MAIAVLRLRSDTQEHARLSTLRCRDASDSDNSLAYDTGPCVKRLHVQRAGSVFLDRDLRYMLVDQCLQGRTACTWPYCGAHARFAVHQPPRSHLHSLSRSYSLLVRLLKFLRLGCATACSRATDTRSRRRRTTLTLQSVSDTEDLPHIFCRSLLSFREDIRGLLSVARGLCRELCGERTAMPSPMLETNRLRSPYFRGKPVTIECNCSTSKEFSSTTCSEPCSLEDNLF